MRYYFAHPKDTYLPRLERFFIGTIQTCFRCQVENPNQPHHCEGYQQACSRCGNGMTYFFDVLMECDGLVALPFQDGMFSAGVGWEMKVMFALRKPVYSISYKLNIFRLGNYPENLVLSVDETIKRLRNPTIRIRIE